MRDNFLLLSSSLHFVIHADTVNLFSSRFGLDRAEIYECRHVFFSFSISFGRVSAENTIALYIRDIIYSRKQQIAVGIVRDVYVCAVQLHIDGGKTEKHEARNE